MKPFHLFKLADMLMWSLLCITFPTSLYMMWTQNIYLIEWTLMSMMNTPFILHIIFDPIGLTFSSTVLFISANVLSFSKIYMKEDKFINRFTLLVILFVMSMNFLIFFPHLMMLLLGWDGLGLTSFILVIYYQNAKSLGAGMITALSNRIGDAMLLIAIALTLHQGHWLIINMNYSNHIMIQFLMIMMAAMTKSAQMPFSSWLPAAMAAPTPVSALVHSSTLVTAGVFLLIRFYPFLHSLPLFNMSIMVIGTTTMFMAGISATTECDMKKIIALSTLSQLGLMMMSIGMNIPNLAFFHMVTHAMFKALLFVCAGSFINYHHHTQDLRWMGNLTNQMPIASSCITIANLALCGFPFMAGFYSKDMIMEWAMYNPTNLLIVIMSMMSIGLTTFYSVRFSMITMWSNQNCMSMMSINEENHIITPMLNLSILAICSGAALSWMNPISSSTTMFIPMQMKLLPIILITLGFILSWMNSMSTSNKTSITWNKTHMASCMMWFLTPLSTQFMLKYPYQTGHHMLKSIDQGWLEIPMTMNNSLTKMNNLSLMYTPSTPAATMLCAMTSIFMLTIIMTTINL